ncbi:LysM peptidoglycan-binding domain-containing protein [Hymenobacter psychrotolerans]|uniref:Membrane-bound lytic murein transglycosylase D n=1 Tax=Hymenobacter psychrotolerans DSM 18569 TaxID=1121959 RepID=A0A1M6S609_9BACT|nr:LysM peptidoglycan-binding domain-containing protein [Hymenobacter psychrotolerans]SHK39947.1 membrane-bound lytic murein transglycosylase D [Hymenobacter psychrotolerans DSM 18569]
MKKLVLALLCWLPLLAAAQSVPVPATLDFAGLHLRLTEGGRRAVQQKVDALRSHPASFQARVNLADAYFPIIERVFQQEALPLDFRFLAIQESGLQGDAQSISDAIGYWQFKRESAADYGVVMNDVVDERKHIVASTQAAAKYLKRNNNALHNWVNTLLSYNLGATGVKPYTLPTDFDATEMEISEKTHTYILTMLAHKLAYEPAVGHNPKPPMLLQEFPAPAGQPLAVLAQSLQVEPAELLKHNRWLLAPTVPTDRIYTVLVPVTDPLQLTAMAAQQKNATAGQLLNAPQPDPQNAEYVRVNGLRALVALPGETKESLAKRAGLKVRRFMQYNDLFAFDNIVVGQPYFVQKKRDKSEVEYHVAQAGESVATVSQKYGIRAKAIWSKNRMPRNEELRPGRILWLKHTRPKEVAIEYADSKNEAALAAFERPSSKPIAAAPAPAAEAPAAKPAPKKRRIDETEPYMGKTASAVRVLEDAVEGSDEPTITGVVTQPDSATDATTENLNDLAPAPSATPAPKSPAVAASPAPRPAVPAASQPAPLPARKALPTSAPIGDEPTAETEEVAATPAPRPATKPAAPAAKPVTTAATPAAAPAPATASTPKPVPPVAPAANAGTVEAIPANGLHTVQPKETLYSVARRYGLRPADLVAWNNLPQNPSLRLGQVLRVTAEEAAPTAAPAASAPSPAARSGIYQPKSVAVPATPPAAKPAAAPAATAPTSSNPAPAATVRHTVTAGESMYAISRKYGVTIKQIMEWNNKPDFNVKPGEVLLVQPAK